MCLKLRSDSSLIDNYSHTIRKLCEPQDVANSRTIQSLFIFQYQTRYLAVNLICFEWAPYSAILNDILKSKWNHYDKKLLIWMFHNRIDRFKCPGNTQLEPYVYFIHVCFPGVKFSRCVYESRLNPVVLRVFVSGIFALGSNHKELAAP